MLPLLVAPGGYPRVPESADRVEYVWSGNVPALVGAGICLVLFLWWFAEWVKRVEEKAQAEENDHR